MAHEYGLGIVPWSPLAQGLPAGKYSKTDRGETTGAGRIEAFAGSTNPVFERFAHPSSRAWSVVDATAQIAKELGRTSAEVALAWVIGRPGVTSTLLGATKLAQLDRNLEALELALPDAARARLDSISALERVHPYMYFGPEFQALIHGGASVTSR
jgi:aryl-alcohol dehydrogenase-like predicted oxidoreductase